jgi:hypothetical protein
LLDFLAIGSFRFVGMFG